MADSPFRGWLNLTLGVRTRSNLLAWAVAGSIGYYLWVYPEQKQEAERKVGGEGGRHQPSFARALLHSAPVVSIFPAGCSGGYQAKIQRNRKMGGLNQAGGTGHAGSSSSGNRKHG